MTTTQQNREAPGDASVDRPTVAIIMRSKDEQPYADSALRELAKQNYGEYVLYNIDSGSTDGTLEAVEAFNSDADKVVRIPPEDYVPGTVLNRMTAMTTESIVVFLNADAIPQNSEWLERLLAPIVSGEADSTISRQIARPDCYFVAAYDYERGYDPKNIKSDDSEMFSAVACAFRRELWEATPFYTEGYAEDLAWAVACQKAGARFRLVPDSVVEHSHNYSIKGLYRKRFRHGVAFVYIYDARPALARQMYFWFRELTRDFLYACRKLRFDTIPYNVLYRSTIHLAYYRGTRQGVRQYVSKVL